MKKQITTAAAIGALLAIACLFWEQQSAAALSATAGKATRAPGASQSPFDRRLNVAVSTGTRRDSRHGDCVPT
ncbi:hypothetical protein LMG28727_06172 [Paraburkholderia kirstenboschensis]|uniref:hypothetical protein n=1 Tax=Paraburkholderia kirstenboschensis TaxID=1245436 RepID=UPI000B2EE1DF|nr:hypothetical protein [Paraburkholderia kirstenboschensis]CAD6556695.1 hypothetical protein LMG28727_06172 [Paraburkholderia kirstenboschensis]